MTKKINKKLPDELENQIKNRNKIAALAGLGGILLGAGATFALLPANTQKQIQSKIENMIYVAGARELESSLSSFAIPFTRYNHVDTSDSVKSHILKARKDLGDYVEKFLYQTAQNQSRAVSGRILEDLEQKIYFKNPQTKPVEILEEPLILEIPKKETNPSHEINKIQESSKLIKQTKITLEGYIVTPGFVSYIIDVESKGNPHAVGSSGERGLMQLMPLTWKGATTRVYGIPISFDKAFIPERNIEAGIAELIWIEKEFLPRNSPGWNNRSRKEKRDSVIAAYNIGPYGFLKNFGADPYHPRIPLTTTRYFKKIDDLETGKVEVYSEVTRWSSLIDEKLGRK